MRLINSRKAGALTLEQVIGLILAIVILLASFAAVAGYLGWFAKKPDDGTILQFNKLAESIEYLYHPDNTNLSCKIERGYIKPDFAIVGFNRKGFPCKDCDPDETFVEEKCGWQDDNVERPGKKCLDKACICLCHGGSFDVSGEDCFSGTCKMFDKGVNTFRTLAYSTTTDVEVDMVLYGESCSGSEHGVIAGYVLKKLGDKLLVIALETQEMFYGTYASTPLCDDIIRDIKAKEDQPPETVSATQGPTSPSIEEALDAVDQQQSIKQST